MSCSVSFNNDMITCTAQITGPQKCLNDLYDCLFDYQNDCSVFNYNNELFLMGSQCENIIRSCQSKKSLYPILILGILISLSIISVCIFFKSKIIKFLKKIKFPIIGVSSLFNFPIKPIKPIIINLVIKFRRILKKIINCFCKIFHIKFTKCKLINKRIQPINVDRNILIIVAPPISSSITITTHYPQQI